MSDERDERDEREMGHPKRKPPRRKDDRVILHFDLDCFYAQCVEHQQPALKALPLGIRQKGILATCNYVARHRGVNKLMTLAEAKRLCPDLVVVEGEDLTPFRNVSKQLYALLRSYSWSGRVERLGLDEMYLDVTDMVAYNVELLNRNCLNQSYFCLSRTDPEQGFEYDATVFSGCVYGDDDDASAAQGPHGDVVDNALYIRLLLASHLARYLRLKIEEEGYTTACGISTNKLLAKLVGNKNKPRNQTTLLAFRDEIVFSFMDSHGLRKVPGIGSKITHILEGFVLGKEMDPNIHSMDCSVTAGQVRTHPSIQSPAVLDKLLGGPGSERGLAGKVFSLLHGVDDTEVKPARDVPTQLSIEDTYRGLNEASEISREMALLSASLLRRMYLDLVEDDHATPVQGHTLTQPSMSFVSSRRWLAHPKTLRLTTRPYTSPTDGKPYNWARASRSTPLPSYVFSFTITPERIVEKLVAEILLPLFHKLNPAPKGWNIGLINVCVTNMAGGNDGGVRDIGAMFRRQDDVLREFTAYDSATSSSLFAGKEAQRSPHLNPGDVAGASRFEAEDIVADGPNQHENDKDGQGDNGIPESDDDVWDDHSDQSSSQGGDGMELCPVCGLSLPGFALAAHWRFHSMGEEDGLNSRSIG
ncbi:hypothetical protein B0H67DRAFT_375047 [Lasiosphaeris hirsuta]|uniref:UmuC domain-containing protein n=1 Tax=Lasiosphaeris hirsuta TaxID=260670 RepID=A0AA39ZX24_9PEZI|nr:hypothetical protein B0H67DRAFT_375047 [Lasiosphaeris hirsuta]